MVQRRPRGRRLVRFNLGWMMRFGRRGGGRLPSLAAGPAAGRRGSAWASSGGLRRAPRRIRDMPNLYLFSLPQPAEGPVGLRLARRLGVARVGQRVELRASVGRACDSVTVVTA